MSGCTTGKYKLKNLRVFDVAVEHFASTKIFYLLKKKKVAHMNLLQKNAEIMPVPCTLLC